MHRYSVRVADQALAAATAETLLQLGTPSTRRAKLCEWGVSFDGITAVDEPVLVELLRQTTGGTASAATEVPQDQADPAALVVAQSAFTVEPTAGDVLEAHRVTPNGGLIVKTYALLEEPVMNVSAYLGLRVTAPDVVNATAYFIWQE